MEIVKIKTTKFGIEKTENGFAEVFNYDNEKFIFAGITDENKEFFAYFGHFNFKTNEGKFYKVDTNNQMEGMNINIDSKNSSFRESCIVDTSGDIKVEIQSSYCLNSDIKNKASEALKKAKRIVKSASKNTKQVFKEFNCERETCLSKGNVNIMYFIN